MPEKKLYSPPLRHRLLRLFWPLIKPFGKLAVVLLAVRGVYPWWAVTPDDPVSPFGSGTTPGASNEPTVRKVYAKFGRFVGDVYWLAWRNSLYGLNYTLKPDWLKDPAVRYEDLNMVMEGDHKRRTFWLEQPDGTWLKETQRAIGPVILLTGYRIEPIWNGRWENLRGAEQGFPRAPRPAFHPNMDARPVLSIRTKRTM